MVCHGIFVASLRLAGTSLSVVRFCWPVSVGTRNRGHAATAMWLGESMRSTMSGSRIVTSMWPERCSCPWSMRGRGPLRKLHCVALVDSPNGGTMTALIRVGVDDDYLVQGAGVRFFTLRGGCPDWINDLDGFKLEALMVISVTDID